METFFQSALSHVLKDLSLSEFTTSNLLCVQFSDRPDLSDYQWNGAFFLAKSLKKNPRDFANLLVEQLQLLCKGIDVFVAGPGFINFKLSDAFIYTLLPTLQCKPLINPSPLKIFIDYGGPNVAKPLHVGHLRTSIIGESIKRILRFIGHNVIGDVHLGDWGTQMGMIIMGIKQDKPHLPYFDSHHQGDYPKISPITLNELENLYPKISALCKENEDLATLARLTTKELQQGNLGYRALWQHLVDVSVEDMNKQFSVLNVSFDQWFGESRYQDQIPTMIQDLTKKGILIKSQGALVIEVSEETDTAEFPPLIVQKSDGGYLYGTTDLATLRERVELFQADLIVYVIDSRQHLHMQQVFRAAKKAHYNVVTEFVGFGTMNGTNGKPFKTRSGGVMRLEELINLMTEESKKRLKNTYSKSLDEQANFPDNQEINDTLARQIGIGALKYADLQHNPMQNYQFDIDKFLSFEGKTGPYLQYAAVRIQAILKKAIDQGIRTDLTNPQNATSSLALNPSERELIIFLLKWKDSIHRSADKKNPSILATYVFDLAQSFSRFYQSSPVLSESNLDRQQFRIFLCEQTFDHIQTALDLLGIEIPEKM